MRGCEVARFEFGTPRCGAWQATEQSYSVVYTLATLYRHHRHQRGSSSPESMRRSRAYLPPLPVLDTPFPPKTPLFASKLPHWSQRHHLANRAYICRPCFSGSLNETCTPHDLHVPPVELMACHRTLTKQPHRICLIADLLPSTGNL